jgi:hypothetical protein
MANTSCYAYDINTPNGIVPVPRAVACILAPGVQSCCNPGDFCLSNTTCFTPIAKTGGGILTGTGVSYDLWPYNYYTAGCTDPTYSDPKCSRQCCTFSSHLVSRIYHNDPCAMILPILLQTPVLDFSSLAVATHGLVAAPLDHVSVGILRAVAISLCQARVHCPRLLR